MGSEGADFKGARKKSARACALTDLFVVPGAGIEPARLAAGDFESGEVSRIHAGLRAICSAFLPSNSPYEARQIRTTFRPLVELANAPVVPLREALVAVLQQLGGL